MARKPSVSELINEAIKAAGGTQQKLADAIGVSQHAVWWAKEKGRVSPEMAVAIDKATGGEISKSMLRPDLFGEPERATA